MKILTTAFAVLGIGIALVASGAFFQIDETEQVIITQFGKPVGAVKSDAGLQFKVPFVQKINRFEKRILEWNGAPNDMPTKDKLYITVDTFGRWRIKDPLQYFLRLRDERSAQSRLEDILGSETRSAVAKHELIEIIRTTKERIPEVDPYLQRQTLVCSYRSRMGVYKSRRIFSQQLRISWQSLVSSCWTSGLSESFTMKASGRRSMPV